jgi:NADH:ubiquinone oxidoreductase subunit 3 (subunit A)
MPRIAQLYFKTAILFLILGIGMGLNMAISQDHSVIGAHAHCNLLGWVTMAIFGGYHALNPRKAERRLAMIQYYVYTAGIVLMVPSLYLLLLGNAAMEPIVAISSIITFIGVLLFAFLIFSGEEVAVTPPAQSYR